MIRILDFIFSLAGLILLSPVFIILMILIALDSRGGIFYLQWRVGKDNRDFRLIKFRTMRINSDSQGQLTIGSRDPRITRTGYFLRKYKLDELTQLINVLKGDMSLVGPRPEVRKYVDLYDAEQKKVLSVRPGITDNASLRYFEENELLAKSAHPEETYIREVMPAKIRLNMEYINHPDIRNYFLIIFKTLGKIFTTKKADI